MHIHVRRRQETVAEDSEMQFGNETGKGKEFFFRCAEKIKC